MEKEQELVELIAGQVQGRPIAVRNNSQPNLADSQSIPGPFQRAGNGHPFRKAVLTTLKGLAIGAALTLGTY